MAQEEQSIQQAQSGQRKRSKRHRIGRNHISDKDRVESVKAFGIYSREVEKNYRANLTPKKNANPFL